MKLYTAASTKNAKAICIKNNIGLLLVDHWRDPTDWPYFAVDNGCYSAYSRGVPWDPSPFLHILHMCKAKGLRPDFAVLPDIVAGGMKSLSKSIVWRNVLMEEYPDFPLYLAVQDGMTPDNVFTLGITGLFVGGSKEWKLSTMKMWEEYAHDHGLKIHVGRMGTLDNMISAHKANMDSIDSTTWVQSKGIFDKRIEDYFDGISIQVREFY